MIFIIKFPVTMPLIVVPSTFVKSAIRKCVNTTPFKFIFNKISIINITICILKASLSMHFVILPFTLVFILVHIYEFSSSILFRISHNTLKIISWIIFYFTQSIRFAILKGSFIYVLFIIYIYGQFSTWYNIIVPKSIKFWVICKFKMSNSSKTILDDSLVFSA